MSLFYEDIEQIKPEAYFQSGPRFKIELEFRNVDYLGYTNRDYLPNANPIT
jgi:hypothetical protein